MGDSSWGKPVQNRPFLSDPDAKPITWSLPGGLEAELVVHALGTDTGLACSIAEHTWQPGDRGPVHLHLHEDEGFYILEGEVTITFPDDNEAFVARAGQLVWHPRGHRHDYVVSAHSTVRLLQILIPGTNLAPEFFEEVSQGEAAELLKAGKTAEFFDWSRDKFGLIIDQ